MNYYEYLMTWEAWEKYDSATLLEMIKKARTPKPIIIIKTNNLAKTKARGKIKCIHLR